MNNTIPAPLANYAFPAPALTALRQLNGAGYEAFLVGGCVRDVFLNLPLKDIDITTSATPPEVKRCFPGVPIIETGIQHGTVTVLINKMPVEITTYRVDGDYRDHRRPAEVRFTRQLIEDCRRRDFTMNALCYNPDVGFIDPFGGLPDIEQRLIRCVDDPFQRFEEDALRILRALRFSAVLGFCIDPLTQSAMHAKKELLRMIAAERIQNELIGLMAGAQCVSVLQDHHEIFSLFLPALEDLHRQPRAYQATLEALARCPAQFSLRFASLFVALSEAKSRNAEAFLLTAKTLKLSNELTATIRTLILAFDMPLAADAVVIRKAKSRLGESFPAVLALQAAWQRIPEDIHDQIRQISDRIEADRDCLSLKQLQVNGHDVRQLGYQGPDIARQLERALQWVLEDPQRNTKEQLLEYLQPVKTVSKT